MKNSLQLKKNKLQKTVLLFLFFTITMLPLFAQNIWINEIKYDNVGGDIDDTIEIAGISTTDLSNYTLELYNGSNGLIYDSTALSGVISDQENGFGAIAFTYASGIQNGAPDGIALVDALNNVIQFLSYEGVMTAVDGAAAGLTSTDIGVSGVSSSSGMSIQLQGSGVSYTDFIWVEEVLQSYNAINLDQEMLIGTTYVPDDNFEQALIDLGYDDMLDDYVLTANISGLTSLNVYNKNIADLTGIEDFVALETLACRYNQLVSLDISTNTALTQLYCDNNHLASLDVSANTVLTLLHCQHNQLTSLDVSANTALTSIHFNNNQLTSFDVSANTVLETIVCYNNQFTNLDLSTNIALIQFYCDNNQLTSLDVSANTALTQLFCFGNQLTSLDIRNGNNTAITHFDVRNNPHLGCIYVDDIVYSETNWTNIDPASTFVETEAECDALYTYVPDDNFEQALIDLGYDDILDDSVLTANIEFVTELYVDGLGITDLTGIEDFVALQMLGCTSNLIVNLDLSNNMALGFLQCQYNQLTDIDLGENTTINYINCSTNLLTGIDVSLNTGLTEIVCRENQLTNLDVSTNSVLNWLHCENNQLTSISIHPNLKNLICFNNLLTNLDVSSNILLNSLYCYNNQLTSLNLSNNSVLHTLLCQDNELSELDVRNTNNTYILDFNATNNPNLICIYVDDATYSETNWTIIDPASTFVETEAECEALYTYVPDDNFEQALINQGYDNVLDDYVLTTNISGTTSIYLDSHNIADLTGIEDFTSLMTLVCTNNLLTSLDLTNNTALTQIYCYNNELTSLDISTCAVLTQLFCSNNLLTALDVSACTALDVLQCENNQIVSLDVSNSSTLNALWCYDNLLENLVLGEQTEMWELFCYNNSITDLDVSECPVLFDFVCQNNQLTSLDVSNNPLMQTIVCSDNLIQSLDFSNNPDFEQLICHDNLLTYLDLRNGNNSNFVYYDSQNNPDLTCIFVDDAGWSETYWINVDPTSTFVETEAECEALFTYVPDDNFEQVLIDLGYDDVIDDYVLTENISSVTTLSVDNNEIADLTGIQGFISLTALDCHSNNLSELVLNNNLDLMGVDCHDNVIISLDFTVNISLMGFDGHDNQLTFLDLRNGNNTAISGSYYDTTNNPDLICIFVDDTTYSETNWINVDDVSTFVETETECEEIGLTDLQNIGFSIQPNPANDSFRIITDNSIQLIEIFNSLGKKVNVFEQQETYLISNLATGVYTVKITTEKGQGATKLIVK